MKNYFAYVSRIPKALGPRKFQQYCTVYPAHGRGHICAPPQSVFAGSRKMAARSAAKFGIAVHSSVAHIV